MKNRPIKNTLAAIGLLVPATAGASLAAGELPGPPVPSGDTGDQHPAAKTDDTRTAGEWEEEGPSRSFLFKELVVMGRYSFDGVAGVPMGDMNEDHFEASPRPGYRRQGMT